METYTDAYNFQPGKTYRLVHQSPTQKFPRVSVMIYLGAAGVLDSLSFSARPAAGTQQMPRTWIKKVERVPAEIPASLNERYHA